MSIIWTMWIIPSLLNAAGNYIWTPSGLLSNWGRYPGSLTSSATYEFVLRNDRLHAYKSYDLIFNLP